MNNQLIYVGGYASPEMEGIQLYNLDLTTGQLTYVKGVKGVENPSFLIVTKDLQRLYAVIEVAEYQGISGGGVVGFEISEEGRNLVSLNNQPTNGDHPCHLSLS
ncbi:MAG: beta-propeller fold lactonase family protein, partial [Deltaproteobacteria bacterium]